MFKLVDSIEDAKCVTHGAKFHADDIFCTVILDTLISEMTLLRVLNFPDDYENRENKIIYDIGYGKFDHHQKGGNGERANGVKYASFGLIWKNFGLEYLRKINVSNEIENIVWEYLDTDFVQMIDSIDNGQLDKSAVCIPLATVSDVIDYYNPNWNEEKTYNEGFLEAFEIAKKIWEQKVNSVVCKIQAKAYVDSAIEKSQEGYIVLDRYMPFQDFVINSDNEKAKKILYAIYPSNRGGYGIQAIQKNVNVFENRKPFPEAWRGLNDEELQNVSGIKTARFCHNAGFLCTTETLEDAISLAKKAVEFDK